MENEKKKNGLGIVTKIWIGLAVVFIILILIGVVYSNQDLTIYPVQCNDWFGPAPSYTFTPPATQDFSSCKHPEAMERQTFSVDTNKDDIIQTSPDDASVTKLNDCTIQDNQHWSCGSGDFSQMPGGMLAATEISRSGENYEEDGLTGVIFVTEDQWNSINGGKDSVCGSKWCDAQ